MFLSLESLPACVGKTLTGKSLTLSVSKSLHGLLSLASHTLAASSKHEVPRLNSPMTTHISRGISPKRAGSGTENLTPSRKCQNIFQCGLHPLHRASTELDLSFQHDRVAEDSSRELRSEDVCAAEVGVGEIGVEEHRAPKV